MTTWWLQKMQAPIKMCNRELMVSRCYFSPVLDIRPPKVLSLSAITRQPQSQS